MTALFFNGLWIADEVSLGFCHPELDSGSEISLFLDPESSSG